MIHASSAPIDRVRSSVLSRPSGSLRRRLSRLGLGAIALSALVGTTTSAHAGAQVHSSSLVTEVDQGIVDVNTTIGYEDASGAGTGIVLTATGEVLTNNHVIRGATSVKVTDVGNGRTYNATVVGYDVDADVALVQLENASDLPTASIGNSSALAVGLHVEAFGNAGGAGGSPQVTSGTITALDQSITANDEEGGSEQLAGLLETNAALQPGDSGGPLVNSSGQVIGMDTAGSTGFTFDSAPDEGFAVPINKADAIAQEIAAHRSSVSVHIGPTAFLGVDVENSNPGGLFSKGAFGSDAVIAEVIPGSPAASAGLSPGDVINALGSTAIDSTSSLSSALLKLKPGAKETLHSTDRFGIPQSVVVTLSSGPPQ